jgi:hypothetical protein
MVKIRSGQCLPDKIRQDRHMDKMPQNHPGTIVRTMVLTMVFCTAVMGFLLPFFFESQSLYYKFGMDKIMLQWGKSAGHIALVLMVWQLVHMSGIGFLKKKIPVKQLFLLHQRSGILIGFLVIIHPVLILGSDGFVFFPLEGRYWPEFTGIGLMVLLLAFIGISHWRGKLKLPVKKWKRIHRIGAPLILFLTFVHSGFVSRTFDHVLPMAWLGLMAVIVLVLFARIYIKRLF